MPHYTTKEGIFDGSKCSTRFKSRAGLTSHVMWAHPPTSVSSSSSSSSHYYNLKSAVNQEVGGKVLRNGRITTFLIKWTLLTSWTQGHVPRTSL